MSFQAPLRGPRGAREAGAQLDSQMAAFSAVEQSHLWGLEWEEEETRLLYIKQKKETRLK